WRTNKKVLTGKELESSRTMQDAPAGIEVWEAADVVTNTSPDTVIWFHRNAYSCVPLTLDHQGISSLAPLVNDPLLHRTFGGRMAAPGFKPDGLDALKSNGPVRRFNVQIATHSSQTRTVAAWEKELRAIARNSADPVKAAKSTALWWNEFWNR